MGILYSSENFNVYPIFFSTYKSGGGDWHYEDKYISINGAGIGARSVINHWSIHANYIQLGLMGNITDELMDFSPTQSFPYMDGSKDAFGYWTEIATMKVSYHRNPIKFEFGKFDRHWGPGKRAIYISKKTPSFPQRIIVKYFYVFPPENKRSFLSTINLIFLVVYKYTNSNYLFLKENYYRL